MADFATPRNRAQAIQDIGHDYNLTLLNCHELPSVAVAAYAAKLAFTAERMSLPSLAYAASRLIHIHSHGIESINVGGTMGCGKSSIAKYLADELGFRFKDADHFHPESNREKMRNGIALTDHDRLPFIAAARAWLETKGNITTCSALSDRYRAILAGQDPRMLLDSRHPAVAAPWRIDTPLLGLIQIIVTKPYSLALEELDQSNTNGRPRIFDGKPHFISVTRESEAEALAAGRTPLLQSQYDLLAMNPPLPWEAIVIDAASMRTAGGYDVGGAMRNIVNVAQALPISA